ncbi:hypothetical protein ACWEN6_24975 [Sphaerisporangium sp. NPDC004334]
MKFDPYATQGPDLVRLVTQLRRDLDRLTAQVTTVTGVPITQASTAFFIPLTGDPGTPSGGAVLQFDGSVIRVHTPIGSYSTLPEIPQAAAVDPAPAIVSGDGPATYNSTWGHNIWVGLTGVKDAHNALRISLINAGLLDS